MKRLRDNGVVRAAKWPSIIIAVVVLLFGSNIFGPAIREHWVGQTKREAIASDVEELKADVEKNEAVLDSHALNLAEHDKGITVIQQKIDGIDERTKQTQEDVREIRRLIIQQNR